MGKQVGATNVSLVFINNAEVACALVFRITLIKSTGFISENQAQASRQENQITTPSNFINENCLA